MIKKATVIITLLALVTIFSPVYAQEGTPPVDTPTPETPPAQEAPPPADEPPAEGASGETETPPPADEVPVDATPVPEADASFPSSEEIIAAAEITLPDEFECELDVIVQRDDWLSQLSEKFYGDVLAFPIIYVATNTKSAQNNTYTFIEDPDLIEPGWKVCVVGVEVAEETLEFELPSASLIDDTPVNLTGTIQIGGAQALSGPLSGQAQSIRNGVDMAVKEVNERGFLGEAVIEMVWEDTAGNKEQAIAAFDTLINQNDVVAIIGPTLSRSAFPAAVLAQAAGVPVVGSSNAAAGITTIGDNIFRTNLSEAVIIENTVLRASELLNLQNVAMIYDNSNAFSQSAHNAFVQALQSRDIQIVDTVAFVNGETDLSAQLTRIQSLNPDAIILNALSNDAADIILQARQLGIPEQIRFIGGSTFNSPDFFNVGGAAVNGTVSGAAWDITINSGSNRQFVNTYQAEYGRRPDQFAAQAYTALWALATALRAADSTDRAAIRDALAAMDLIESPLGLFQFDDTRNPDHAPIVLVADGNTFVAFQ